MFEGCIEEAVSICFSADHYEVTGIDMYFGEMKITSHQNVTNNATDLLKKAGGKMVMLVNQQEFYDRELTFILANIVRNNLYLAGIPTLRTLDMQRFEDNERFENMKFHSNTFRPEYSARCKPRHPTRVCSYENQAIVQAREKVLDWDERNKRNASVVDFAPLAQKAPAASSLQSLSKRNRPTTRVYSQLVNESISDDEEPPPQVEIKLPAFQPKIPPKEVPAVPSPYQRPTARVYDVELADVQVALNAIKLRRQASANLARAESSTNGKQATGGATACPLNIIPAGYSMGNVHFDGSTLGASEVGTNKRDSTASLFNRHVKPPRKEHSESRLRKPRYEYRKDDGDSSSEEEVVRKLTITPFNPDEDNEQW